jgi:uncharacterized protein
VKGEDMPHLFHVAASEIRIVLHETPLCRISIPLEHPLPEDAIDHAWLNLTQTHSDISWVCPLQHVPEGTHIKAVWLAFELLDTPSLQPVAVLAYVTRLLAEAGTTIFVLHTYRGNHVLVKQEDAKNASHVLRQAGVVFI